MYPDGEYDLAGFAVGVVEKATHHRRRARSRPATWCSGLRLERRALERLFADPPDPRARAGPTSQRAISDGRPLADVLLAPTRIYVKPMLALMQHAAGQGAWRTSPAAACSRTCRASCRTACSAVIERDAWPLPPLFDWLQAQGKRRRRGDASHLQLRHRHGGRRRRARCRRVRSSACAPPARPSTGSAQSNGARTARPPPSSRPDRPLVGRRAPLGGPRCPSAGFPRRS